MFNLVVVVCISTYNAIKLMYLCVLSCSFCWSVKEIGKWKEEILKKRRKQKT